MYGQFLEIVAMPRIYEISKQDNVDWIFLDNGRKMGGDGYISYRNVICRALHFNLHENAQVKQNCFDVLKSNFEKNQNIEIDGFVNIYFVKNQEGTSVDKVFLVDKTGGCFPLVFGNSDVRISALKEALDDIEQNWASVLAILEKHQDQAWGKEIEEKLIKIYNNSPKKADT